MAEAARLPGSPAYSAGSRIADAVGGEGTGGRVSDVGDDRPAGERSRAAGGAGAQDPGGDRRTGPPGIGESRGIVSGEDGGRPARAVGSCPCGDPVGHTGGAQRGKIPHGAGGEGAQRPGFAAAAGVPEEMMHQGPILAIEGLSKSYPTGFWRKPVRVLVRSFLRSPRERDRRVPRAQRRGEDHDDKNPEPPRVPGRGKGDPVRRAGPGRGRRSPPHRLHARAAVLLRIPHGRGVPSALRPTVRDVPRGHGVPLFGAPRQGRAFGSQRHRYPEIFQGDDAAARARPGAAARPGTRHPRRADVRTGSRWAGWRCAVSSGISRRRGRPCFSAPTSSPTWKPSATGSSCCTRGGRWRRGGWRS